MVPQGLRREEGRQSNHGAPAQITEPARAANDKSPAPAGPFAAVRHLQPDPTTSSPTDPDTDTSAPEPSSPDTTSSSSTATSTTGYRNHGHLGHGYLGTRDDRTASHV